MKKIFEFMHSHKLVVVAMVLIIGGSGFYFYNKKNDGLAVQQPKMAIVEKGDIEIMVNGSGQIQAESQVDLKPQVAGDGLDVTGVFVSNNQEVKKGELIATLDSQDAEENVRDARLSLSTAQIQYEETAREFNNKTVEESWKRELASNAVKQRVNALNDAIKKLEDYKIEAPFDGIVTGLSVEAGDSISRDETLVSVITEDVKATIALNEVDAAQVKIGNKATLVFDALDDDSAEGTVSKVDTIGVVEQGVVTYDVEISFIPTNELLKPGMSVSVEINIDESLDVVTVPVDAVKTNKEESFVLIKNSRGEIQRKIVTVGLSDDVMVEIISGIDVGEEIIIGEISAKDSEDKSDNDSGSLLQMGGPGGGRGPR